MCELSNIDQLSSNFYSMLFAPQSVRSPFGTLLRNRISVLVDLFLFHTAWSRISRLIRETINHEKTDVNQCGAI